MRTLLKFSMDVEAANETIRNGEMPRVVQEFHDRYKPEALYFYAENGKRTGLAIFDLPDPSDIPSVAEPFFTVLKAEISMHPCMNLNDLKTGVAKATQRQTALV